MNKYRLLRNCSAVSSVIGAILVFSLVTTLFIAIYSSYIPAEGEARESENLRDVYNNLLKFRQNIASYAVSGSGISTFSFNLGTAGYVLGSTNYSPGSFSYLPDAFAMSVYYSGEILVNHTSSGAVSYVSQNQYYPNSAISMRYGTVVMYSGIEWSLAGPLPFTISKINGETVLKILMLDFSGHLRSASGTGLISASGEIKFSWSSIFTDVLSGENATIFLQGGEGLYFEIEKELLRTGADADIFKLYYDDIGLYIIVNQPDKIEITYASVVLSVVA